MLAVNVVDPVDFQDLKINQRQDADVRPIIEWLEKGVLPKSAEKSRVVVATRDVYFLQNEILYHIPPVAPGQNRHIEKQLP